MPTMNGLHDLTDYVPDFLAAIRAMEARVSGSGLAFSIACATG